MDSNSAGTGGTMMSFPVGGYTPQKIPRIRLESPLSGSVVVSDDLGELYCVNADNGTIRRLRWE